MKAFVEVKKDFDDEILEYSKDYEYGDFEEFFKAEGEYLDKLSEILKAHGIKGNSFEVTFKVKLER